MKMIHAHRFRLVLGFRPVKSIGQTELRDHGPLVGRPVHDCKSLCAAVTICATLVDPFTADPVKALHVAILV